MCDYSLINDYNLPVDQEEFTKTVHELDCSNEIAYLMQ